MRKPVQEVELLQELPCSSAFSLSAKINLLLWIFWPCCETMGLSLPPRPVTSEPNDLHHPGPATAQSFPKHNRHQDICAEGPHVTACSTSQIFIKHQGIPRKDIWFEFPAMGIISCGGHQKTQSQNYSQIWVTSSETLSPSLKTAIPEQQHFAQSPSTWALPGFVTSWDVSDNAEMEQRDQDQSSSQPGTGQIPAPKSTPSHNPSSMTSSLLTAQIPAGLVSRTDVHWFTAGRVFGRAATRSIIIF